MKCIRCGGTGEIEDLSRAEYFRELRLAAGWPVKKAAHRIGVNNSTIYNLETKGYNLSFSTIIKVARVYGISLDDIPEE